jgi:S-DNA-T family DNA segregation ATPase FtsK/SpoIIIE
MGLFPLEAVRTWSWLKWLPHTRDPEAGEGLGRVGRAVTADAVAFAAQFETLAQRRMDSLRRRMEAGAGSLVSENDPIGRQDSEVGADCGHVIVVVDGYRPGFGPASLDTVLPVAASVGMTVVVLVHDLSQVPASCGARVDWTSPNTIRYVASGPRGRVEAGVVPDSLDLGAATQLARTLAPLSLLAGETGANLADPVRLTELLGADDADELDLQSDWIGIERLADGAPPEFLAVPIGRRDDGSAMMLDFKEAAASGMGPHGMLVGAAGSGKSQLLRSLTAALAARHDPSLVNVLLIDFRDGVAFADLAGLPHVAGLVTKLADDLRLVNRIRLALRGELARRQEQLRLAGNLGSIAHYQAARAGGAPLDPMPYLVVVVDEFGKLLAAKPDVMDTFLMLARLGTSLGVHLLLATRRLDESRIRGLEPHLRYRLCLRTGTAEESRAVLSNTAAFELPSMPGLGYLRVDSEQAKFKAAICGTARTARLGDTLTDASGLAVPGSLLRPLSLGGASAQDGQARIAGPRADDLQVLVEQAQSAAANTARQIWTPPLPTDLTLGGLDAVTGGGVSPAERGDDGVTIGIADWPERQAKQAVRYRPDGSGGNVGIAGASGTGKSTLLQSLVLALAASEGPDRRQFYVLDLGGSTLFELEGLPHVGAVVGSGETEAAARLFRELRALLDERAGASQANRSGSRAEAWSEVFLVVDNVGRLRQSAPDLEPQLIELATAGFSFGLHVLLSANRWLDIRPQLLDALSTRWELHLADPADSHAGRQAALQVPVDMPGRGLIRDGHLFQAALPDLAPEPSPGGLAEAIAVIAESAGQAYAPKSAPLPLRVTAADAARLASVAGLEPPAGDGVFLLGVSEFRSRPAELDLERPGSHVLVYGDRGSGRTTLLRRITAFLRNAPAGEVSLCIADPARGLLDIADGEDVFGYAANIGAAEKLAGRLADELLPRVAPEDAGVAELREGKRWSGPRYVLIVDDYDLLTGQLGGPFTMLTDLLAQGTDIGFSVILTRQVAGSQRTAQEQFGQRLREVATTALILSGQPDQGPLVSGVSARQWPPGRGILIPGHARPRLIQCCLAVEEPTAGSESDSPGRDEPGAPG